MSFNLRALAYNPFTIKRKSGGTYYKVRVKAVSGKGTWMDDYNTPGKKKGTTKRFKSFATAKRSCNKSSWGTPHHRKIVRVTRSGTKTVYAPKKVFK